MGRWWVVLLLVWACRSDPPAQTIDEPSPGEQEARIVRESFRRVLADFHGDVIAGRIESAYARLAPMLRERLPLDRFTAMRTHPFFSDGVEFTVRGTTEATSTAKVSAFMKGPHGTSQLEIHCTRIDGVWKIAGITLDGAPLF